MLEGTAAQLQMVEGDYGIALPFTFTGIEFSENDCMKFTFKKYPNGYTILEKVFENITNNTIQLEFTEQESMLFTSGNYVFSLDWYQNDSFLGNIINNGSFKVVDKV